MNEFNNYIRIFTDLKNDGIPKDQAEDYLEFDSDEYPDMYTMHKALDEVYGK